MLLKIVFSALVLSNVCEAFISSNFNIGLGSFSRKMLAEVDQQVDFNTVFQSHYFPTANYSKYSGMDEVSMSGSAVSIDAAHAAVASFGDSKFSTLSDILRVSLTSCCFSDIFNGQVQVYAVSHNPLCTWSRPTVVKSPVAGNNNFGSSVSIDGPNLAVGANAFSEFQLVFAVARSDLMNRLLLRCGLPVLPGREQRVASGDRGELADGPHQRLR